MMSWKIHPLCETQDMRCASRDAELGTGRTLVYAEIIVGFLVGLDDSS